MKGQGARHTKDEYVDKLLNQNIPQLIPYTLLDEYGDFINDGLRNVVRASCLRRYLEGAIELLLRDKILETGLSEDRWNKLNLYDRINEIGKRYSKRIKNDFDKLRIIGNNGSHYNLAESITEKEISEGIEIASRIIEERKGG